MLSETGRRKLKLWGINCLVVILCGILTFSIPYLVHRPVVNGSSTNPVVDRTPGRTPVTDPDTEPVPVPAPAPILTAVPVPNGVGDYYFVWQLQIVLDDAVVTTWSEIYAAYVAEPTVLTVSADLLVLPQGLVYKGDDITHWQGQAMYQGQSVGLSWSACIG